MFSSIGFLSGNFLTGAERFAGICRPYRPSAEPGLRDKKLCGEFRFFGSGLLPGLCRDVKIPHSNSSDGCHDKRNS